MIERIEKLVNCRNGASEERQAACPPVVKAAAGQEHEEQLRQALSRLRQAAEVASRPLDTGDLRDLLIALGLGG